MVRPSSSQAHGALLVAGNQPLPWSGMGNALGEAASQIHCLTLDAFVTELRVLGSPLRQFLLTAWGARQNAATRRTWPEVTSALVEEPRPRWMQELLQVTFGLYRLRW